MDNKNVNDDEEDLEYDKKNIDDNDKDSFNESESESQQGLDPTKDNAESVELESISRKRELTTDEILELYKNVVINEDELISAQEIIKMYETDVEETDRVKDLENVKKSSRRKKPLKKSK